MRNSSSPIIQFVRPRSTPRSRGAQGEIPSSLLTQFPVDLGICKRQDRRGVCLHVDTVDHCRSKREGQTSLIDQKREGLMPTETGNVGMPRGIGKKLVMSQCHLSLALLTQVMISPNLLVGFCTHDMHDVSWDIVKHMRAHCISITLLCCAM